MSTAVAAEKQPTVAETGTAATAAQRRRARLVWIAGAAGVSLAFTVRPLHDPDVWWHLALGRLITEHGIPAREPFSFDTPAAAWVGQQWGYEVVLSRLFTLGGAGLLMVTMGLVASAALLVAALATRREERIGGPALAASMVLSSLVAVQIVGVRGQVITMLGVAVVLLLLSRWRDGSTGAPWLLVPVLLLWANLHAGFGIGLAMALVAALTVGIGRARGTVDTAGSVRTLVLATAAGLAATLVNPAGPHLWGYVAQTFTNPTLTQGIVEWQSPDFHNWLLRLFELQVIALVLAWVLSRRPDPLDVVLALTLLAATLQAQRNVALFAVVAVPQLARYSTLAWRLEVAPRLRPRPPRGRRPAPPWFAAAGVAVVTAATAAVAVVPLVRSGALADDEAANQPKAAADFVAAHLDGQRLYSTYEWGGYLAYRFGDQRVVWIYGESAIFGDERLQEYLDVHLLRPGWEDVLARHGMRHALVPARSQEAAALLEVGWRALCADRGSGAVVLERGDPRRAVPPGLAPSPTDAPDCA